eukprot:Nitzschia sp. Nitz4//scaffold8_size234185//200449//201309//NITZ4_001294-RA/size234185-augustus-gene-0.250-mRNA-1//1//CDS//3329559917//7407//frame0
MQGDGTTTKKDVLVQRLEGALQKLRSDRDHEYRAMVEAQERVRLCKEEEDTLAKIVKDMRAKQNNLSQEKANVEACLKPLEIQVQDLTKKVQFQHSELIGAREKIEEKKIEVEETSQAREEMYGSIQRLVQERRHKLDVAIDKEIPAIEQSPEFQIAALERELNCSLIDWDILPSLLKEKADKLASNVQRLQEENQELTQRFLQGGLESIDEKSRSSRVQLEDKSTNPGGVTEYSYPTPMEGKLLPQVPNCA